MLLSIIYQDEYLVAINKPSGLLVHRSMLDKHETQFAVQLLRDQIGQHVFPVHRLDRPTSGVMVFALSADIARKLGEQFAAQLIEKTYLAIVRGHITDEGKIDYALKEKLDKIADKMVKQDKSAQHAVTIFKRLDIHWRNLRLKRGVSISLGDISPTSTIRLLVMSPMEMENITRSHANNFSFIN